MWNDGKTLSYFRPRDSNVQLLGTNKTTDDGRSKNESMQCAQNAGQTAEGRHACNGMVRASAFEPERVATWHRELLRAAEDEGLVGQHRREDQPRAVELRVAGEHDLLLDAAVGDRAACVCNVIATCHHIHTIVCIVRSGERVTSKRRDACGARLNYWCAS